MLLVTIAAHAMLPTGSPLVRSTGSAFSAETIDVAITPKRKAAGAGTIVALSPAGADAADQARADPGGAFPAASLAPVFVSQPAQAAIPPPDLGPDPSSAAAQAFRARAPPIS